jgi:hypothetical protein
MARYSALLIGNHDGLAFMHDAFGRKGTHRKQPLVAS